MANSETGDAINLANFKQLISYIDGYGAEYNPGNPALAVAAVQNQYDVANAAYQQFNTVKATLNNSKNLRAYDFAPIKKLGTKIMSAMKAARVNQKTLDDAQFLVTKIRGGRIGGKKDPDPKAGEGEGSGRTNSVSQQSFDKVLDNFQQLINIVTTEAKYTPNETELSVAGLNDTVTALKGRNDTVKGHIAEFSNARLAKDVALYANETGLYDTALDIKQYLKSVFDSSSIQYKQVSKLKFTSRPKK